MFYRRYFYCLQVHCIVIVIQCTVAGTFLALVQVTQLGEHKL